MIWGRPFAGRTAVRGTPYVNHYEFTDPGSLKVLKFEKMTDEWLDFIAACRNGGTHGFDVVEGPMADDTVWNFVNSDKSQAVLGSG